MASRLGQDAYLVNTGPIRAKSIRRTAQEDAVGNMTDGMIKVHFISENFARASDVAKNKGNNIMVLQFAAVGVEL